MKVGDIVFIRREENGGFSTGDMRKRFGGRIGRIQGKIDDVAFCVDIPGTGCCLFQWSPKDLMEVRVKMT